ncbi:hypothetical protein KDH_48260 [Dictyobacter sp. S3.2.2.5]|uniref:Uncharacterized protein n=1 Tax=Dictyobacter halimunensis TaxID=3026934 RepID=A0ABQ6G013_9CHLR|nr:hypothetical protein KDH_48260 [Dictyobacter sp. S3.2.2.5]
MIDWEWALIDELETAKSWQEAKAVMLQQWEEDPTHIKACVRLAFLCWYTVVEQPYQWQDEYDLPDYDECLTILRRLTSYGLEHFTEDINFLWTFGYMMSLFAEYFCANYSEQAYLAWEQKGEQMLEKAHSMMPDDPMFTMILLSNIPTAKLSDQQKIYKVACRATKPLLASRFQGKGEMQRYFLSVLNRDKKV